MRVAVFLGLVAIAAAGNLRAPEDELAKEINKLFCRGGVGVEVLEVFWEELWLHFFWLTFWLHCTLYRTYAVAPYT